MFIHYYCTYCSYVYGHKRRVRRACDVLRVVLLSAISYIFFLMCCRVGMSVVASPCRGTGTANTELAWKGKGGKLKCTYTRPRGRTNSGKVRCLLTWLTLYLLDGCGCPARMQLWRCLVPSADEAGKCGQTDNRHAGRGRPAERAAPRASGRVGRCGGSRLQWTEARLTIATR